MPAGWLWLPHMYDRQRVARGAGAAIAIWTLIGLVFLSTGVAYAVPLAGLGGFNATIGVVESDSLALYPAVGDTSERDAYPQAIVELENARLEDLEAYKDLDVSSIPGLTGTARFRLASRGEIDSNNALIKTAALTADDAQFDAFEIADEDTGDVRTSFEIFANDRARLESVKIRAHYLTASSVDLSDLSLSVCYDSNEDGTWERGPCDGDSTFVRNNDAPFASASATPQQTEPGTPVSFDASASSDVDGSVVSYEWNFGDGGTASGQSVSHSYDSAGDYTATLTVTDNDGATSSDIVSIDVRRASGDLDAQAAANTSTANPGQLVVFDGLGSSAPDGFVQDYQWEFGDGSSASGDVVRHTYGSAGTYTATLTTTSDGGETATDTVEVTIEPNQAPSATATANRTDTKISEPVAFDGSATDSDGRVTDYTWDFGDGTTASGPSVTHTFTAADDYTVTLTTRDNDGATSTDTVQVSVVPNQPPSASVSANKTAAKIDRPISFDGSGSSDPDGSITSYEWRFGDGSTASGPTATHSYGSAGTYDASLTVTDDNGDSTTETVTISIDTNDAPSVTADATPTTADPDETVSFSGSATDPDGSIESYEWDFGDGATATGPNPSHAYGSTGTYTATLTVTDSYGTTASDTVTIDVSQNASPSVSLSANRTEVALGEPIAFDATVSDSDGSVSSTEWQLGDGTTASGTSTVHSYSTTGYFTVEFYATDDDGATTGKNLQVHVTDGTSTSSPSGPGTARLAVDGTDELVLGEQLESSNGDYRLVLQSSDGNLVLRNTSTGNSEWASNTAGDGGTNLTLQSDGNLVSYTDSGTSVWASDTAGSGADELVLEDDGRLVLYASGSEVWSVNG